MAIAMRGVHKQPCHDSAGNEDNMGGIDNPMSGRSKGADHLSFVRANGGDPEPGALLNSLIFEGLSTQEQNRLLAGMRVKEYSRGDVLYMEDDDVGEVLGVLSGLIKITKVGASGAVVLLRLAAHDAVLGAADLISPGRHTATAEALRSGLVLSWRASVFKTIVESRPASLLRILRTQADWLRELEERFHEMATDNVGPRVARQLVRLHETMVQPSNDEVEIPLSHEELAQMTGTNLYAISRLFADWQGSGVVSSRRQVVSVRDVQLLREISECRKREV
jgi:CRP/FNR family transcriptional regulator, nitrogen oxide reductase regulator